MHPEFVKSGGTPSNLKVNGFQPRTTASSDVLPRNIVRSYHDLYLVRAGVAYVDNNSTFCFADVNDTDPSGGSPINLPNASAVADGFRIEGIKGVSFEVDGNGVKVYVIAEGDNAVTGRNGADATKRSQEFQSFPRWSHLTFQPEMYYEEFEMYWRTRNIEQGNE
jgi:hypothetical protein